MSYDIRIAVRVEGADPEKPYAVIAEPEYSDPTYNIGKMLRVCTGWDFEQGKFYRVSDVYEYIVTGIRNLTQRESNYKKYNSPNGWGNTQSALNALRSLKECIDGIENGDVGWNRFPKSILYVAW